MTNEDQATTEAALRRIAAELAVLPVGALSDALERDLANVAAFTVRRGIARTDSLRRLVRAALDFQREARRFVRDELGDSDA